MDRLCGFGVLTGRDVVLRCPGSLSFTLGIIRRFVSTAVGVIVVSKDLANLIHKPKFSIRPKLLLIFHAMDAIKRKVEKSITFSILYIVL